MLDDDIQEGSEDELHDARTLGEMDDDEFERLGRSGSKYVDSHGGNCETCEPVGESGLTGMQDGQPEAEDDQEESREVPTDTEVSELTVAEWTVAELKKQRASPNMRVLLAVLLDKRIKESGSWMVHEIPRRGFCK